LALLFLLSLSALDRWEKAPRFTGRTSLWLGLWLGLCLLTEVYAALIIVPAILVYVMVRLWQRRPVAKAVAVTAIAMALPQVAIVGVMLYFYWLRFGGLAAPRLSGQLSLAFIPVALYGFIFSTGKSFFLYVPPAFLAIGGVTSFYRRQHGLAILLAAIAGLSVLFISTYVDFWHGDAAWGPRFLFHLTLIAVLPLGEVLERGLPTLKWKRIGFVALIILSIVIQIGGVLINVGSYIRLVEVNQLGDQHFVPYLSPVIGHWILAVSTVYHGLTGQTLSILYPTGHLEPSWRSVDTAGYDGFDLWFVHLPQYWHNPAALWVALVGVLILLIAAVLLFRYLWHTLSKQIISTA